MPPAKTWYFHVETTDFGTSFKTFTSEHIELKKGCGKPFGSIVEISPGNTLAQEGMLPEKRLFLIKVCITIIINKVQ